MASEIGIEGRARKVLEVLSNQGPLPGYEISDQCSFGSRMIAAGTIASLLRRKAIEGIPAAYRITETGKIILAEMNSARGSEKPGKEPQSEPSSGQSEESP